MLQSLRKNKVVKNAGWIIGGKVANKLLAFVVGIFAARYLGPSNYGLINYAAAYATFFASLCTLGINSVIVKNFVDHPDQQGETIGTTLLLRAISSLLSALAIIGIVSIVDRGERLTVVVVALYSIGLVFQVFDTLNYWFQARLQSKYSAIAELVSYAAMSVYKIILLALGKSVEWFAVASALDYIVLAVFLLIAYFKNGGTRFHYSLKKAKELLQSSSSFIIAGLMVSIYACTDKLMLKQMLGADAVGHYSLASTVSVSWAFILSAIIDSLYPEIVQSFQKDRLRYERKNRQLYAIVFYVSLFVSAMICLVAKPFILILYVDERGSFTELLKTKNCGQISVNITKPGITKGQHWHNSKWEFFMVVAGHGLIQERQIGSDEKIEFEVSGDRIQAVHMLPGYTHNIINLSETENLVTVMWANEQFDSNHPDTYFEEV